MSRPYAILLIVFYLEVLRSALHWFDRRCAGATTIELMRFPGNDSALDQWRIRYEEAMLEKAITNVTVLPLKRAVK